MEFFTTPNSKNIISTLHIVTIEKSESKFLILYFHALTKSKNCENTFKQEWMLHSNENAVFFSSSFIF